MKAYIDGSSIGMYGYIIPSKDNKLKIIHDYPMTNNQAEWLALLSLLLDLETNTRLEVFSDSQIVVNQLKGIWETKDSELKHLRAVCLFLIQTKKLEIDLQWVPRNENLLGKHLEKIIKEKKKKRKKLKEELGRGFI